jgi:hypothetical protein
MIEEFRGALSAQTRSVGAPHRGQKEFQAFQTLLHGLHVRPVFVPNENAGPPRITPARRYHDLSMSRACVSVTSAAPARPSTLVPSENSSPRQPSGSVTFGMGCRVLSMGLSDEQPWTRVHGRC